MLEQDKMSLLESGTTTNQIQLLVLKDPIRNVKNLAIMKFGHSLNDYYCPSVESISNFKVEDKRLLKREKLLVPKVEGTGTGTGEVYLTKKPEDKWKYQIRIRGQNLHSAECCLEKLESFMVKLFILLYCCSII